MARGVNSLQTVGASKPRSRFATCTEAAAADDDDDDDAILYYCKVNSDLPTLLWLCMAMTMTPSVSILSQRERKAPKGREEAC